MNFYPKVTLLTTLILSSAAVAAPNTLTGDWAGNRTALDDYGLSLQGEYTNVVQSAVSGGDGTNVSHRFDLLASLDIEKLGGWSGGKLHTQVVARGGEANDFGIHYLSLANSGQYGEDNSLFFSSFYYSHQFSSNTSLLAGKIDAFELLRHAPFYGGATRHGFLNIAFAAPPSGVTPPSFVGAIANRTIGSTRLSAMVYDPRDRYTNDLDFSGLFEDGVNVSVSATHNTQWFDRGTSLSLAYTYSTEEGIDYRYLDPEVGFTTNSKYKYNARAQLSHNLVESEQNSRDAWGVHIRAAIADGNPNIIDATLVGGIGGSALFFNRPMDSWGLGYYYYDLSNDLQDSVNSLPIADKFQNEHGFEAYYSYQAMPWLTFTADVQYLTPAVSTQEDTWLLGLRTNIRF
ncbi:carbohydrate porin [Vibrio atypicus]|uniref:carbohydrate porin n=1 Tax=Vibrio atypicus TaxID=558271 RepID=UPI00135CB318|nr:carbohydrate porin [Vibrio atypicus]